MKPIDYIQTLRENKLPEEELDSLVAKIKNLEEIKKGSPLGEYSRIEDGGNIRKTDIVSAMLELKFIKYREKRQTLEMLEKSDAGDYTDTTESIR